MQNKKTLHASAPPAPSAPQSVPVPSQAKVALIFACLFWAASFIATKTALTAIPPLTVVALRMIISSACFGIWLLFRRKKMAFQGVTWLGHLFLLSLFGTGLHFCIQTIGLKYTTAANASLYSVTGPISISIIAVLFLGEKISWQKIVGILTALIGVIVVMGVQTVLNFKLQGHLLGDLLVFASIFMWGIYTVLGKKMTHTMNPLDMTAIVTFLGTLTMIPVGWIEMKQTHFSLTAITVEAWSAVAFLGITCSFLATLLYVYALHRTESQKVGVYLYTIPPMTYIIAGFYLGETIGLNLLIGSLVVLAGVYMTETG